MDSIVEFAKKQFEDVDAIIETYTMTLVYVSDEFAKQLLYTPEELKDFSARTVVAVEYTKLIGSLTKLSTAKAVHDTKPLRRKDGVIMLATAEFNGFEYQDEPYIAMCGIRYNTTPLEKLSGEA